jgi:hypothetical protein
MAEALCIHRVTGRTSNRAYRSDDCNTSSLLSYKSTARTMTVRIMKELISLVRTSNLSDNRIFGLKKIGRLASPTGVNRRRFSRSVMSKVLTSNRPVQNFSPFSLSWSNERSKNVCGLPLIGLVRVSIQGAKPGTVSLSFGSGYLGQTRLRS